MVGLNLSHLERFVPHWILNRSLVIICRKRQRAQRTFNEAVHRSFQMLMTEKFSDAPVGFELSLRIRCQGRNQRIQMRCLINPLLISCFPVCVIFSMQILHHHIASVEKLSLTTTGCPLFIQCRNFRVVHFVVQRERDCHDVYSSLLRLLRPGWFHCVPA